MTFNNPVIAAEAARKTLQEGNRLDANHNETSASRAVLDAEELHELEHSLYYEALEPTSAPTDPLGRAAVVPKARRSLLDRLFRRG